jgi:putative ABC transport system permease protein
VEARIQALGANLLTIYPGQSMMRGVAQDARVSLTLDDAMALARGARHLVDVVPELARNMQVERGNQNFNLNVVGTTPNYTQVRNYTVPAGRMFTAGDDETQRRYAVLGHAVPDMLNANALGMIGQSIQIGGAPFEIIGILSEKGGGGGWQNSDEQILIPLQTARYRVMGTDRLRSVTVQVESPERMNLAMIEIERVLRREHHIRPGEANDFMIRNQADVMSTFQETTQTFSFLLAGIATVSLLVGGIGIMNIMLVSVTERTREIGIRMATGARQRDILQQFLSEAIVVSAIGGVVGVVVGVGAGLAIQAFGNPIAFTAAPMVLAFGCAAATGLIFGYAPARKAAKLDPVVALANE